MRLALVVVLCFSLPWLATACASRVARPVEPLTAQLTETPSAARMGELVREAYRSKQLLEMEAEVCQPRSLMRATGRLRMRPRAVEGTIHMTTLRGEKTITFEVRDGHCTEKLTAPSTPPREFHYALPEDRAFGPSGLESLPDFGEACLVGTWPQSWIGDARQGERFASKISEARFESKQAVNGVECTVWLYDRFPPFRIRDTYWIGPDYLVRRWDTVNNGIYRTRSFRIIRAQDAPDSDSSSSVANKDSEKTLR